MSGLTTFGRAMAVFGMAATAITGPVMAQSVDYGGSNGRVHYDHYRDRGGDHHGHHHGRKRHHDHDRHANRNRSPVIPRGGFEGRPSSGGAYVGNISGYEDRGNGTYFYVERDGGGAGTEAPRTVPSARIIRPGGGSGACSNEAGVCVIRPGG